MTSLPAWLQYLLTTCLVVIAYIIREPLGFENAYPYVTFNPIIAIIATFFGGWQALLSLILSLGIVYHFILLADNVLSAAEFNSMELYLIKTVQLSIHYSIFLHYPQRLILPFIQIKKFVTKTATNPYTSIGKQTTY